MTEAEREEVKDELGRGLRGHIFFSISTHTHTLKRIYGRLRAVIDKITCLFDPMFNNMRKGVVCVCAHL